jgi:hypothetical protein
MNSKLTAVLAAIAFSGTVIAQSDPIVTQSTSNSTTTTNGSTTTKVISPPPSAISPAVTIINSDVCAIGYSGAAQTQILGISFGGTTTDKNCERLKLSRSLYDMGMKVAAVSALCQDERVFTAMMNAGTPCPVDGQIGASAKDIWENNPDRQPQKVKSKD